MMIVPAASITCACGGAFSWAPTAAIFRPSMSTSPLAKSPTFGSMLTIVPPRSRMGCREAGLPPRAVQGAGVVRDPGA